MTPPVIACAIATAWLVVAIRSNHFTRFIAKPIASMSFLAVAVEGQPSGTRGWLIAAGLVMGAAGDIALMWESTPAFLAGLTSFLVGHVTYLIAFSFDSTAVAGSVGATLALGLAIVSLRRLGPHLAGPFRIAVPAYTVVICGMVATAIGSASTHPGAALGAVMFAASDLLVARQRFVTRSTINATVGLPLYYAAQLLIALSI
jgi:uncharacterized membrane protein YhhN